MGSLWCRWKPNRGGISLTTLGAGPNHKQQSLLGHTEGPPPLSRRLPCEWQDAFICGKQLQLGYSLYRRKHPCLIADKKRGSELRTPVVTGCSWQVDREPPVCRPPTKVLPHPGSDQDTAQPGRLTVFFLCLILLWRQNDKNGVAVHIFLRAKHDLTSWCRCLTNVSENS